MKRIFGVMWILIIIGVLVGCDSLPEEEAKLVPPLVVPEEVSYKTKLVERGDIEDAVTVRGEVVPIQIEYLFVEEKYTRLESINVGLGDEVVAGDIVLNLLSDSAEESIRIKEININSMVYDIQVSKDLFELQQEIDTNTLLTLETPYSIKNHESQMEIKQLNHNNNIKSKENSLAIERLQLTSLREDLENTKVKSTIDGTVVFIKRIEEGDTIEDYDKLIGIADVSAVQGAYQGSDASEFSVGNEVIVTYMNVEHKAIVTMTPGSVPDDEKEIYKDTVFFSFVEEDPGLARGNIIDIKLVNDSSDNALLIPKSLLLKSGDDKLVYVLSNGLKEERYVTTGVESGIYVEITGGLEEGEEIIVN